MPPPQALAHFPGVQQIESCSVTLSHGITPGVASLSIAPQANFVAEGGTLNLQFGNVRIRFDDCKVNSAAFSFNSQGFLVSLAIFDRRWKWAFGAISGEYNLREDDGKIVKNKQRRAAAAGDAIDDTERTPQELAKLCLEAIGETRYNVSDLPNDSRPTVEWDYDNPAQALARLCDDLGCRVVLELNGRVAIRKLGRGRGLPNGPIIDDSQTIDPPERPDELRVVTGKVRHQGDFKLEAVGLDTDEQIKPIDDLSYKPAGGWGQADFPELLNLADQTQRELAKKCIFRWYRIRAPIDVPGYGSVDNLRRVLPIESQQVEKVQVLGVEKAKPAVAFGIWYSGQTGNFSNTATVVRPIQDKTDATLVTRDFEVDEADGIVKFGEPVYQVTGAGTTLGVGAADLRLRTALSVRDAKTRAWKREEFAKRNGQRFKTKPRYIKRDEINVTHVADYGASYGGKPKVTDNLADVRKEANHYLDAAEREYQLHDPQQRTYAGWLAIDPDGALQTVTWSLSASGATTVVSRNQDLGSETTIPYKLRRKNEETQEAIRSAKAMGTIARQAVRSVRRFLGI